MALKGTEPFSEQEIFLVSIEKHTALRLAPLLFWKPCPQHVEAESGHCYFYDIPMKKEGSFSFKAVAFPCPCEIGVDGADDYKAIAEQLHAMQQKDQAWNFIQLEELTTT